MNCGTVKNVVEGRLYILSSVLPRAIITPWKLFRALESLSIEYLQEQAAYEFRDLIGFTRRACL